MAPRIARSDLMLLVRCLDLTSLSGSETHEDIKRLCQLARNPVDRADGHVAAVCLYPEWIALAREQLAESGVRIATVAGFPSGSNPLSQRVAEIRACVEAGADEVDVVLTWPIANRREWSNLATEVAAFRKATDGAQLKTILVTGLLDSTEIIETASRVALDNGADFIKTSTGKESINATLEAGAAMCRELASFYSRTGQVRGLKPAGGIRTPDCAMQWLQLVQEELGTAWLTPAHFRIGASSLLAELRLLLEQTEKGVKL